MKFTFKTHKPTGPYRSFGTAIHDIKLNKVTVGSINDNEPYHISFMVVKNNINEDKNLNCSWKWIRLKKEFRSLEEAKEFVNTKIEDILEHYNLHYEK